MSRVANSPVELPSGVEFSLQGGIVTIKGPKGELKHELHPHVEITKEENLLKFSAKAELGGFSGSQNVVKKGVIALTGTTRAIINNNVTGVSQGFEKKLTMVGVGYRAQVQGNKVNISAGFSHPVLFEIPAGITIETPSQTEILVKGACKQMVGQVAANLRAVRPPEPYKGKGIRYADEHISIKETKKK